MSETNFAIVKVGDLKAIIDLKEDRSFHLTMWIVSKNDSPTEAVEFSVRAVNGGDGWALFKAAEFVNDILSCHYNDHFPLSEDLAIEEGGDQWFIKRQHYSISGREGDNDDFGVVEIQDTEVDPILFYDLIKEMKRVYHV